MTATAPRPRYTITLRVDDAEHALIKAAAAQKGQRPMTWARDKLIRAAKRETAK